MWQGVVIREVALVAVERGLRRNVLCTCICDIVCDAGIRGNRFALAWMVLRLPCFSSHRWSSLLACRALQPIGLRRTC